MANYESVQEALFFLEYKMHYDPETIENMKYHVIRRRIDQYLKYKKAVSEAIANSAKKLTNK